MFGEWSDSLEDSTKETGIIYHHQIMEGRDLDNCEFTLT